MLLTGEQLNEVKAICDQICQTLETDDEYTYDLDKSPQFFSAPLSRSPGTRRAGHGGGKEFAETPWGDRGGRRVGESPRKLTTLWCRSTSQSDRRRRNGTRPTRRVPRERSNHRFPLLPRGRYLEFAPAHWTHTRTRLDPLELDAELGFVTVPAVRLDAAEQASPS